MWTKTTKCGKKKGEYCRIHSPKPDTAVVSKEQFLMEGLREYRKRELAKKKHPCTPEAEMFAKVSAEREAERRQLEQAKQQFLVDDMEKHMKLVVDPKTGMKTVSVYRAGVVEPPKERGVEKESYLFCDEHKPDGRQARTTTIFASPTMNGVSHWVRGVSLVVKDWGVRELRVNPDEVYVYSVRKWEKFSNSFNGFTKEGADEYWNSGMTLTEWYQQMRTNPDMKPEEWELLLGEDTIKGTKNVKADTVARSSFYHDFGERSSSMYDLLTRQLGRKS